MKNSSFNLRFYYLLAFIIMTGSSLIYGQNLRKGPYLLYDNNNTQMEVLWQTDATSNDQIQWGLDQNYTGGSASNMEYGSDHQHKYIITGLTPGTKYYYRVTIASNSYTGSFFTSPPTTQTSLKFFAYGDTRTYPVTHNEVAGLVNVVYANDQAYQTFILSVGDLVGDGNSETAWTNEFFPLNQTSIKQMFANIPMLSCRGNHEGAGVLFSKYFPYPYTSNYYWSFDYGPAHFAIVDQYIAYTPGSAQYTWLQNDLAGSTKSWKFIYLHEPGWSAYGGHANNINVQEYIEPLCEQYNVAILFAGHNHYYARAVVNGNGATVQHVTSGGGGAPLHTPDPNQPNIVATSMSYHYCKINIVSNELLEFQAVSTSGAVIDQFNIVRSAPPVIITNVQANSITANSAVITWTTDVPSTSTVEYGLTTSYGSTATGAGNVTIHSVNLTGLIANSDYHYRVNSGSTYSGDNVFHTGNLMNSVPFSTTIQIGKLASGTFANLATDNSSYYVVNSVKSSGTWTCDWYGSATTTISSGSASKLTVTYNGKYSKSSAQKLYLFNWVSATWALIDSRNVSTSDVTVTYITTAPANYISTSGEMRLRVYSTVNGNKTYRCSGDFMQFTVESAGYVPGKSVFAENEIQKESEELVFSIYPNPFNSTTTLEYELTEEAYVQTALYDINGREVMQPVPGIRQDPGKYEITIDGKELPRGLYICKLIIKTNSGVVTSSGRKMMLMK